MAVAFADIFMSRIKTEIISKSKTKPLEWKRCIEGRKTINQFVLEANTHHPTITFTAEISEKEITFLHTTVFKGKRFYEDAIVDIRTHLSRLRHFNTCTCVSLPVTLRA